MKDAKPKQDFSWFWQHSPDIFVSLTPEGKILDISPAARSMLAYHPKDLQGRFLIEFVVDDDVESASRWLSDLPSVKMRLPLETRMVRQDERVLNISWDGIWANNERVILCVGRDVTDRTRVQQLVTANESRVRTILECVSSGIVVCDIDGRIEETNRACQSMFGADANTLRGKTFVDLLSVNERQRWSFDLLIEQAERAPVELSFVVERASMQLHAASVEIGSRRKCILSLIDISDRKQLDKIRQDVFSMITHELRSPLSAVQGILEMLGEGAYGEVTETAADRIIAARRNVSRLLQVLETVLDAHKIQDGKVRVNLHPTSLDGVIDLAMDSVAGMAERKNVTLHKVTANRVILADNVRLQQVMVNLLSNAIKASPRGSTIEVNVLSAEAGVVIEVADTGKGIPEEFHPLIFEKFEQIPGSFQSQTGSSGLGLTICKNIVDQHGGQIGVRANEPTGSIFWFILPHNCGELPRAQHEV